MLFYFTFSYASRHYGRPNAHVLREGYAGVRLTAVAMGYNENRKE
jgi:hypothetical protein